MTDRELMQMALYYMDDNCGPYTDDYRKLIEALRARLVQPETQEIEIRFTEWLHPQMGVVPVDPKTPLILKVRIALPSPR